MDHIETLADEFASLQKQTALTGSPTLEWAAQLESRIDFLESARVVPLSRRRKLNVAIGWAAAVVVVLGAGLYFMLNKGTEKTAPAKELATDTKGSAILPGTDKAVLTLADGRDVQLNGTADGILAEEGGSTIRKINSSTLVYEQLSNQPQQAEIYNTISTPRGGQYQVVLPDRTKDLVECRLQHPFSGGFHGKRKKGSHYW